MSLNYLDWGRTLIENMRPYVKLCVHKDARCSRTCVLGENGASGTQDAHVTRSLRWAPPTRPRWSGKGEVREPTISSGAEVRVPPHLSFTRLLLLSPESESEAEPNQDDFASRTGTVTTNFCEATTNTQGHSLQKCRHYTKQSQKSSSNTSKKPNP